jgi:leucyl/phenylalanyl-tRNA--protein transferase
MNRQLSPDILLAAYAQGVFPMADPDGVIGWYSPDPRAIIPLESFHVSRTLRQRCRQGCFEIRLNTHFEAVVRNCADRSEGTWISDEIVEAYCLLHRLGFAHCVESWQQGDLVGGLYGVTLGGAFFGESMFHRQTDASKVALVHLVERMRKRRYTLLDVQFTTPHLEQFGVVEIPRDEYLRRLGRALELDCRFVG